MWRPEPGQFMRLHSHVLVRALAILLVVASHSHIATGLVGGMNVLLLLSGVATASYGFRGTTGETLHAFWRMIRRVVLPGFILASFWAVARSDIYWRELIMISNWFLDRQVAYFPIWYIQTLLQMLLFFMLVFWSADLTPRLRSSPIGMTLALLSLSLVICLFSEAMWNAGHLSHELPQIHAWNFVLGWTIWAVFEVKGRSVGARLGLSAVLFASAGLIFIGAGLPYGPSRFVYLLLMGLILIWFEVVEVPRWIGLGLTIVSRATFAIFLFHMPLILGVRRISQAMGADAGSIGPVVGFLAATVMPIIGWAFVTALRRTWGRRRLHRRGLPGYAAAVPAERTA